MNGDTTTPTAAQRPCEPFVVRSTRWLWLVLPLVALMMVQLIVVVPAVMVGLGIAILLHTSGVVWLLGASLLAGAPVVIVVSVRLVPGLLEEAGLVRPGGVVLAVDADGVHLGAFPARRSEHLPWSAVTELTVLDRFAGGDEGGYELWVPCLLVRVRPTSTAEGYRPGAVLERRLADCAGDPVTQLHRVLRECGVTGVPVRDEREHTGL